MATRPSPSGPLLLIPFFLGLCDAQGGNRASERFSPPSPTSFSPSMAVVIVILVTAFLVLGFVSIYLRQCGDRHDRFGGTRTGPAGRSRRAAKGLDASVIESLPTLVYSDVKGHKIGKGALECAVCLCEFEDDETLRLLPACDHVFHQECIDKWLSARTTCPVCRANLEAPETTPPVADPVTPPPAAGAIVDVPDDRDRAEVPAAEPETTAATTATTDGGKRRQDLAPELARMGSRKTGRSLLPWRSRSARPAVMQHWAEEDRERFTLRLPDHVRREVLAGKLNRSASIPACRGGEGNTRRGYGGEGSSRVGGRSFKMGGSLDWVTSSDRWAFLSRPLSFKLNRHGRDGEGPSMRREGSTSRMGEDDGEGSAKGKAFARGPLDCLGGGGGGGGGKDDARDQEGSTAPFCKV